MPENEFEKKVSSELQQLRFKPADTVWMKVEERIRKKKRRRVFIILFLLAGIALTGYWQWDDLFGESKNPVVQTENNPPQEITTTPAEEQETGPGNENNDRSPERNPELNISGTEDKNETKNRRLLKDAQSGSLEKPSPDKIINKKIPGGEGVKSKPVNIAAPPENTDTRKMEADVKETGDVLLTKDEHKKDDNINKTPVNTDKQKVGGNRHLQPVENKTDSTALRPVMKSNEIAKDSLLRKIDSVSKGIPADSPVVILPQKADDKKWKWGAQFIPGISVLGENGLSFTMNKSADALSYQNPSAGSGGQSPRQQPSAVKPGFAFQLGGFLQRNLSQKTDLSVGLQYGYYSTRIGLGQNRDSLLRFAGQFSSLLDASSVYNAGGDTLHHTNRYHFIELPLRFQWQLNKNPEWPISWNAGVSFSYLFATNALMYDTAFNGIYYQNNKLLNRTQISLSTGFSFTISNNRRMQWGLGPFVDMHLNKIVDNHFERKKYLFFTGVRTSVIFKD